MENNSANTKVFKITRLNETEFKVVTGVFLSDHTIQADVCILRGRELKSAPGGIRVGGLITVKLGPISFKAINELEVGATAELIRG